jgi:hypothetical protein
MPGGDRTGPAGFGPRTGRAFGYCAGYGAPGYMTSGFGRGFHGYRAGDGPGARGGGRGWRNRYWATGLTGWQRAGFGWTGGAPLPAWEGAAGFAADPQQERELLEQQVRGLERSLASLRRRIAMLGAVTGPEVEADDR